MNIRILVLFIAIAIFTGGCATSTPYPIAPHTHGAQNVATVQQQQVAPGYVVQQHQTTLPRALIWEGMGPSQPIDNKIATWNGVVGVFEKFYRAKRGDRYYGGYYGGYGYNSYSALMPVMLRNAQFCNIAYQQGHVRTPYC